MMTPATIAKYGAVSIAGLLGLGVFLGSFYSVDSSERVVVTRGGSIIAVSDPGYHLKVPYLDATHAVRVDIFQDKTDVLNTYTIDNQEVDAVLGFTWKIPDDQVAWVYSNNRAASGKLLQLVTDRWKIAAGKVNVTDFATNRGAVVDQVRQTVTEEARRLYHVDIVDLGLLNLDYTKSFRDAQAQAAVVKTQIEQSQGLKAKAAIDADTAKISAAGEANQQIERARGQAESRLLQAKAEAEATRLQGEAQAAAQELMAKALSSNPALVSLHLADRWNGALPTNIYGSAPIPFLPSMGK